MNEPVKPHRLFDWLGKNKSMVLVIGAMFFFSSYALVIGGQLQATDWLASMAVFVPLWITLAVAPGAYVKRAEMKAKELTRAP